MKPCFIFLPLHIFRSCSLLNSSCSLLEISVENALYVVAIELQKKYKRLYCVQVLVQGCSQEFYIGWAVIFHNCVCTVLTVQIFPFANLDGYIRVLQPRKFATKKTGMNEIVSYNLT